MSGSEVARRTFLKGAGAAMVAGKRSWTHPLLGSALANGAASSPVAFDARSLIFSGKRELMVSGEMHYARSTRAMWPALLDRSKALGLNSIAAYVFWNVHEPERNIYDFSGEKDLGYFLTLCKERGIYVFLRTGPYCCAEWNYGGYPPYLRDEPGITIRTMNQPYLKRVEKYFERLAVEVNPHLATRGGPVVLIQVENEYANVAKRYGAAGQEYLRWMADLAKRIGFADVPTTMCEGAVEGPIATLNGSEITANRIGEFRAKNTHDPLLWTELYPAWYDVWGETREAEDGDYTKDWSANRSHDPRTMALTILVFIANGGAGFNYYMWHGGTNFGRTSMYLMTTSYDFAAPLDEYGCITFKGEYLGQLHKVLRSYQDYLFEGERASAVGASGAQRIVWKLKGHELALTLEFPAGAAREANPHPIGAKIVDPEGKTVFDTQELHARLKASWNAPAWKQAEIAPFVWHAWSEPLPEWRGGEVIRSEQPTEQLILTKDHTDYCWYSTSIQILAEGTQELVIPYGGDFFYVFVDGKPAGQTVAPLKENRGPITPEDPAHPRVYIGEPNSDKGDGFRHVFKLDGVAVGRHRLDILSTALGMIKGDWQIVSSMEFERKGIWEGVLLNGQAQTGWEMIPYLAGERAGIVERSGAVEWAGAEAGRALCWYKTAFQLSSAALKEDADYRFDAAGLGKGMLFLNGRGVGRHWLIVSPGAGGEPTQRYYHLPKDWLRAENTLVVFEEQAASPKDVRIERRGVRA